MKRHTIPDSLLGVLNDCAPPGLWALCVVGVLLALCGTARAEEPAFWPPCDAPDADPRCPSAPRPPPTPRTQPELQCSP